MEKDRYYGWNGCETGDCPHDTIEQCNTAMLAELKRWYRIGELARALLNSQGTAVQPIAALRLREALDAP